MWTLPDHEPFWIVDETHHGEASCGVRVPYYLVQDIVKDWPAHWRNGVQLWQTLRADGGNLGLNVGDDPDAVLARRYALADAWGGPLVWLNQVHGKQVFCVNKQMLLAAGRENGPWAVADAAVTQHLGVGLAVLTADCLPVVLVAFSPVDQQAKSVAVAHAGWKGLAAGVLQNTVDAMLSQFTEPLRVEAWLGPAIGPAAFEVGNEVKAAFLHAFGCDAAHAFTEFGTEKWLCNLYTLAQMALKKLGVECIASNAKMGHCTVHESYWFSHRRALQRHEVQGRMATIVGLSEH